MTTTTHTTLTTAGATLTYSGNIVDATVTTSGIYDITAYGAQGGLTTSGNGGGLGAIVGGDIFLQVGDVLEIVVGGTGTPGGTFTQNGGGGGGSFVIETATIDGTLTLPIDEVIAGGGGGVGNAATGGAFQVDSFRPDPERASALAARTRRRLASSFAHVLEAALSHLAMDPAPVRAAIARIAAAANVPPAIFILHRRCVRAAVQGDLVDLRAGFERLSRSDCASPPGLRLRNWGDVSFSPEERDDYRWIFTKDHGDLPIAPATTPQATYARACAALARARVALRDADAALADEIETLIGEIVFAVDAGTGSAFDGATSFFAQGALLLNAAEHVSVPEALSGLVHEAAHSWLFAETEGAPLVENDPAQRYASPLRADPRPMNGIYHATIVSARMACALDAALAQSALDPADKAEAQRLLTTSRNAFASGRNVVRAQGRLIPLARRILEDAETAMASLSPPTSPDFRPLRPGPVFTLPIPHRAAALQGH